MPTYEYVCTACDNHWEEVQKISENALEVCPKCGKSTAKRQISAGNFILKGGGWYADLYSSSKKADAPKTDAGSKDAAGSTSNGAADATGAASGASAGKSDAGSSSSPSTTTTPAATPAKPTPGSK